MRKVTKKFSERSKINKKRVERKEGKWNEKRNEEKGDQRNEEKKD
jgi:hypothetical protein